MLNGKDLIKKALLSRFAVKVGVRMGIFMAAAKQP